MSIGNNELNDDRLFSRKKSLLTLQQYASSQGISAGVVEECAKLGVVQIRKHKNKTFIVDLPLDASKSAKQQDENKVEHINTAEQAQRLSGIVNKIFQPSIQQNKPVVTVTKPTTQQPAAAIPDLKIFAQEENKAPTIKLEKFEPLPVEFKVSLSRKIFDAFKLSTGGKVALAFMAFGLAITIAAFVWSSLQNHLQQQKLEQAYENIGKLVNEYDSTARKTKMLEIDSANWKAEAQRNQQSIASLQVQLVQTKEKLSETQESLAEIQQNHVDTLKKINEQLQEITQKPEKTEEK
ncbi:MAG: hypothetical protein A2Y10_15585 [Planctomycetes bacterium GWF2_41_51]|nr:MAG: hypothetical protein A2Y10_15585 [Planctomycetes bacterium GWF2_41_51]HBG27541.1 hypothetical protein [Phycisphaerales bacterium]